MGTHLIPRSDVKGQDRFFIFFTLPGLIGTIIALVPALPFFLAFQSSNIVLALCILGIFGFVGFIIGQGKIPDGGSLPLSRKVGGLYIRDIIRDYFKFKKNKTKYLLEVEEDQQFDTKEASKVEKLLLNDDE